MKLPDKQFTKICHDIARDTFKVMKKKIEDQLKLRFHDSSSLDVSILVNVIINSLAILDANMIIVCKKLYEGINHHEIKTEKLISTHNRVMNEFIASNLPKKH